MVPTLIQPVKLIKKKLFKLQTLCDESDSVAKRNLLLLLHQSGFWKTRDAKQNYVRALSQIAMTTQTKQHKAVPTRHWILNALFSQVRDKPGLTSTAEADDMKRLLATAKLEPRASAGFHFHPWFIYLSCRDHTGSFWIQPNGIKMAKFHLWLAV